MPRRSAVARPAAGRQSILSFQTRVTKAIPKSGKEVVTSTSKEDQIEPVVKEDEETVKLEPEELGQQKADEEAEDEEEDILEQHGKTHDHGAKIHESDLKEKDEEIEDEERDTIEARAMKIPETAISRYWLAVQKERISQAVHQEGLDIGEKILRYFDLSSQYGPCIGMTRLRRWKRAERLGLNPPIEVLAVLLQEESRDHGQSERAHIDELLNPALAGASSD